MKRILFCLTVLGLAVLGCAKSADTTGTDVANQLSSVVNASGNKITLAVSASAYEAAKDDKGNSYWKYLKTIAAGQPVTLLGGETKTEKVLDYNGNWNNVPIAPARLEEGKDVSLAMYYIFPNQQVGAVIAGDKTNVYTGLKAQDITTDTLPRGTIVAVAQAELGAGESNPMSLVRFYAYNVPQDSGDKKSFGNWASLKYYIAAKDVSTKPNDVGMVNLLNSMENKPVKLWPQLISGAETEFPDSVFLDDAREKLANAGAAGVETVAVADVAEMDYSAEGVINDNNINIRQSPNVSNAQVIGLVNKMDVVTIVGRTMNQYTVSGVKAYWYKIKFGQNEGWVFGQYISIN